MCAFVRFLGTNICTNNGLIEISISIFACKAAGFVVSICQMADNSARTHAHNALRCHSGTLQTYFCGSVCVPINADIICRYCC